MTTFRFFGPVAGEKQLSTSFESLIDGLTVSRSVQIKALSTNPGDVILRRRNDAEVPGAGMRLEPGEVPMKLSTRYDNSYVQVRGSVLGCTVTYIGDDSD